MPFTPFKAEAALLATEVAFSVAVIFAFGDNFGCKEFKALSTVWISPVAVSVMEISPFKYASFCSGVREFQVLITHVA